MSIRTDEANARRGPSNAQPVMWVYKRRGLPVEVRGQSGDYIWIRDQDGAETWMHQSQLSARRTAVVLGAEPVALLAKPRAERKALAQLAPGVVTDLERCEGGWRRVRVAGTAGWVEAERLFGAESCADR
jgi:SH3-like domain-containing protein